MVGEWLGYWESCLVVRDPASGVLYLLPFGPRGRVYPVLRMLAVLDWEED
jgi:hypothetical protein